MSDDKARVVELGAHIPSAVRMAAEAAYVARSRLLAAQAASAHAMRSLSRELKRFKLRPEQIQIGDLDGRALVPFADWREDAE